MGDRGFDYKWLNYRGFNNLGFRVWCEGDDVDIEEEKRERMREASEMEGVIKEHFQYCVIASLNYDEYFANNPHLKCEDYLIDLRIRFERYKDEYIDDFINRILRYTKMERTSYPYIQNILIVNGNNKFTFLNTSKLNPGSLSEWERILENGQTKLQREYSHTWKEGDDSNKKKFKIVCVKLRDNWENED